MPLTVKIKHCCSSQGASCIKFSIRPYVFMIFIEHICHCTCYMPYPSHFLQKQSMKSNNMMNSSFISLTCYTSIKEIFSSLLMCSYHKSVDQRYLIIHIEVYMCRYTKITMYFEDSSFIGTFLLFADQIIHAILAFFARVSFPSKSPNSILRRSRIQVVIVMVING